MAESSERELTPDEASYVSSARDKAFFLYEGVRTPHRSCGIALAETFGLATPAYQALRRGGITGKGACGAIRAGEQVLGELLGDPDPIGAVTPALRAAVTWYQTAWQARLVPNEPDIVCDNLVRRHGDFAGPARKAFCTNLAAEVAALTAEALCRFASSRPEILPLEDP
ncbi:MAG TPA: hypothetical protein VHN14_05380 [Kofleriaceae bacterium]|jgi:hypothetical protein|nr:hypothetical protein [Kofleriaceae bacterium]